MRKVFVLSNDIVPGLGMPVAAPGLRAFGLAEGLRANGLEVKTVVPPALAGRQWGRLGRAVPHPTAPDTDLVSAGRLSRYLGSNAPAAVVMTNSNQVDHLGPISGVRYVLDFFAPKMLEELYHHGEEYPAGELARLARRKEKAIRLADAFIVNGEKKVPYFLAWIVGAGRDIRNLPLEVVNMGVPLSLDGEGSDGPGVRLAVAGYLQSWSTLGDWVTSLEHRLDAPGLSLSLVTPRHWGTGMATRMHESQNDLDRIASHQSVETRGSMTFSDFQKFLGKVDVTVDLFRHNLEREYAMVTRSVVSLACGVPVIHPPFTEVSPLVSRYDAGWLVDPEDREVLEEVLDEILGSPETLREKRANARALAREVIDPGVSVGPLLKVLKGW